MTYKWINTQEIQDVEGRNVILFGAGEGTIEFLIHQQVSCKDVKVLAIADNDASFWGRTLLGHEIISPDRISAYPFDKIIVTSISGRDSIDVQLNHMGMKYLKDYILIGSYPSGHAENFLMFQGFMDSLKYLFKFNGAHCLHIGPGGFLGLEVLLYCFGAEHVTSIDLFRFSINQPDITQDYKDYQNIKDAIKSFEVDENIRNIALQRFKDIIIKRGNRIILNSDIIEYIYPMDVCELQFKDNSFDLVLSFAVLEHVCEPWQAVWHSTRTLKPGGFAYHTIMTQDHRSYSNVAGYTPFSFRTHSRREWADITKNMFYQNRLLPVEWKNLMEKSGLHIDKYIIFQEVKPDDHLFAAFHPDFNKFSDKELSQIDCTIIGRKIAAPSLDALHK